MTLKSVLHDWPEADARLLLRRAAAALRPGGTLMVFERGPLELGEAPLSYAMITNLLFVHFFRPPEIYLEELAAHGFHDLRTERIELETPFNIVTGRKPQ